MTRNTDNRSQRRRPHCVRSAALTLLMLALALQAPSAGQVPSEPVPGSPGGPTIGQGQTFSELLGPWIRNDGFSEHPVQKARSLGLAPEQASSMRAVAQSVADKYATVMIRTVENRLVILDSRGGTLILPIDGKEHRLGRGVTASILEAGEKLTIEMVAADGRQVETFLRDGEWLVRSTDVEPRGLPSLQIDTVYERPGPTPDADDLPASPAAIRIVPPERGYGELLTGRVEIQTLVIDPRTVRVEFILNGRARKRPFRTRIRLANPPRRQTLEVLAYAEDNEYLGRDEFVLNRIDRPFAVRIGEISGLQADAGAPIRVAASVSLPHSAMLERVEFYRSESLVQAVRDFGEESPDGPARTTLVEASIEDTRADDFIRVVAKLADGREREDAKLIQGAEYQSEIDVQLVQFQVLVTDREGNPVSGLSPEDFEIRDNGRKRTAVALHTAYDVPLILGLAIDSSDSMLPVWSRLKFIARSFLETAVTPGDRAFLVDFDDSIRLAQPLTGDRQLLADRLDYLVPMGGTALNDGLLFSLLQYRSEPGRRALVVITDGADQHSRSRPEQSSEFAERLGLPIYFIELDASDPGDAGGVFLPRDRRRLQHIAEQTGGRLLRLPLRGDAPWWGNPIEQIFDRIEEDLRHQHVLTYYTNQPRGVPVEPEIRVTRRDLKLRSAVPLEAID